MLKKTRWLIVDPGIWLFGIRIAYQLEFKTCMLFWGKRGYVLFGKI